MRAQGDVERDEVHRHDSPCMPRVRTIRSAIPYTVPLVSNGAFYARLAPKFYFSSNPVAIGLPFC